jgi:hypothetical protein
MDLDLNEIASSAMEFNWEWDADGFHYQGWFSNFVLDDQHSDRVVATYDRFNNPAPQGIIGVTDQPTDW